VRAVTTAPGSSRHLRCSFFVLVDGDGMCHDAGSIAKGVAKGGVYVAKNVAKKAPYAWKAEVRPWMANRAI
jgi:hypothetical protein